jgi:hypothetical protein
MVDLMSEDEDYDAGADDDYLAVLDESIAKLESDLKSIGSAPDRNERQTEICDELAFTLYDRYSHALDSTVANMFTVNRV